MIDLPKIVASELAGLPSPSDQRYQISISSEMDEPAYAIFGAIRLSSRFLTYLWWASCLFNLRYRASFLGMKDELENGERRPLVEFDQRIHEAHQNFGESRRAVLDRHYESEINTIALNEHEVGQVKALFLRGVAWVIYHETAHLELGHSVSTPENEHEADRYATDLISQWPEEADLGRTSRFGQMTAVLGLHSIQSVEQNAFSEVTHPAVYRRILQRFEQFELEEKADEYHFSLLMLRGDLTELGVDFSDEPQATSLRESFLFHIEILERYIRETGTFAA